MRDFVLFALPSFRRTATQIVINLAFRNGNLVFHLALADTGNGHFFTDILAKLHERNPILLQSFAKLDHRHFVACGNALQRLFELRVINAQTDVPRMLQLYPVHHQTFEHLLLKHISRWQGGPLPLQLIERQIKARA